ncbi:RNA methyltransferase [bacterium]|nr:RNA methyltransferase [bacterium]
MTTKKADTPALKELTRFDKKLIAWGKRIGKRDGEPGIFLEGIKLIDEAVAAGHPLKRAWFTSAFIEGYPSLITKLIESECEVIHVSARLMNSITSLDTPPGITAVASQPGFIHRKPGDPFSLIVAVTRLQDPGNLGGVSRTADYFGVDEVWLGPGSVDPYSPKAIRGSMGSVFRMPILKPNDFSQRIKKFQQAGAEVWAAVVDDENAERKVSPSGSRIIMVGGESAGICDKHLMLADKRICIPGAHRSESLNLAVATGILIYSATSGRF